MAASSRSKSPATPDCLFDLLVIGSGPAGQRAALQAAKEGKKVAVIEKYPEVGGACIHFGTIPSKSFRESVYRYSLGSRGVLGREAEVDDSAKKSKSLASLLIPEMGRLVRRKDRVVRGESAVIRDQLKRNGISVFHGEARFLGPAGTVPECPGIAVEIVAKQRRVLSGNKIIVAVGARPVAPSHLRVDSKVIHDSDTILELDEVPKTMVVLGAGVIGCEYASMFAMAGTKVTLVDKRDRILGSVDREIVRALSHRFESLGMEIVLKAEATRIELPGSGGVKSAKRSKAKSSKKPKKKAKAGPAPAVVHLSNGRKLKAETVLVAMGRLGNTEELGLAAVGIQPDERGLIKVDAHFRSSASDIYAVGDVIGAPALAATAMEQGRIACCHAFGISMKTGTNAVEVDYEMPKNFPYGIYTIPEISMIGKTEEEVKAEAYDYVVGRASYRELARGQIVGDQWGLLKLIVDRKSLRILGVHIVGDNAADLIHIGQAVMAFGGDVTYFINSVFNYPTLAEAYKTAAFGAFNVVRGRTSSSAS